MNLIGSWLVAEIDGRPVLEDVVPTMEFDADGRVFGAASVNRFHGGYTLADAVVSFSPLATTLMMGLPGPMEQETRFLAALGEPLRVVDHGDGDLLLTNDEHTIRLTLAEGGRDELIVAGTVFYRERIAMPPGAVIGVQLVVTPRGEAGDVIASSANVDPGNVPVPFEFRVPATALGGDVEITVEARIDVDGDVWWRSDEVDVHIVDGSPQPVEVLVRRVPS